jgi:hypothetical protein
MLEASASATTATDIVAGSIRPGGIGGAVATHAVVSAEVKSVDDQQLLRQL